MSSFVCSGLMSVPPVLKLRNSAMFKLLGTGQDTHTQPRTQAAQSMHQTGELQ
jgi:hypothetical protein